MNKKFQSAVDLFQQGNLKQAQVVCDELCRDGQRNEYVLNLLGLIAYGLHDLPRVVQIFDEAIVLNPGDATAYSNRGVALTEMSLFDDALDSLDKAIQLDSSSAQAYYNRGNAHLAKGQPEAALSDYLRALDRNSHYAEAHYNIGTILDGSGNHVEAISHFDRALMISPAYAEAHYNRARALRSLGQYGAAAAAFRAATETRPDYLEARWNLALTLLLLGEFISGWEQFEWGWQAGERGQQKNYGVPLWLGKESLAGKTILLHAEQGFGDTLQFCRFAVNVAKRGASEVILEAPEVLHPVLDGLEGVSRLISENEWPQRIDYHCPLMSLPLALRLPTDHYARATNYLRSPTERLARWQGVLGAKHRPRVGLAWSGNVGHRNDRNRSIALAQLVSYLPDTCDYFSLQKDVRELDKPALQKTSAIHAFNDDIRDFGDTAAICELMDVVVSVDTSVAHLAGGLCKEVWIMLPREPDWRWLLGRSDSIWYPSARLFRQESEGDWSGVLESIHERLASLA